MRMISLNELKGKNYEEGAAILTNDGYSDKPGKANTSGAKGVSYRKTTNNYVAYIGFKGKLNIIGYFKTLEEAAAARKQAEEELYKPILEKYNYKSNKEN